MTAAQPQEHPPTDEGGEATLRACDEARRRLLADLRGQFPPFCWEVSFVPARRFAPHGALEPLERGQQEKLFRRWDVALVVPNELKPRDRVFTLGAPESAAEADIKAELFFDEGT